VDPLTLLLVGGAALLVFVGLRGGAGASSSQAQQQTEQGAELVQIGGTSGAQTVHGLQTFEQNANAGEFKGAVGAAGAGVSAGTGAVAAGASTGSAVTLGAVTFGAGALVGLAVILWSKHEARLKGAKTENAAMNIIIPGWIESLQGIIAQYNAGQINDLTAAAELTQLKALVYSSIQKYNHTPGVDWAGGGSQPGLSTQKYWSVKCDKRCTIGCCLFNGAIGPGMNNAIALVSHKQVYATPASGLGPWQNSIQITAMAAMPTYGFKGTQKFVLTVSH
jgi:hypothetical protein